MEIKDIRSFNKTLLAKWSFRIVADTKGKWRDIISSKYEFLDLGTNYNHFATKVQSRW